MNPYTQGYFENQEKSNYREYEDWPQFKERADYIVKTYNPKTVFEIGAAKGFLIKHLRDLGVDARGIDMSEWAASHSPYVDSGNFALLLDPPDVDLICSFDVLEHIPEEELDKLMDNLKGAKAQFHMITTTEYDFGGDETHVCMHPKDWWVEKFKDQKNCTIIHAGEQEIICGR